MLPVLLQPDRVEDFPDPMLADSEGLVAVGGDLSRKRLLLAYDQGVFPWFDESLPLMWWSPDPRAILPMDALYVSKRLQRRLRSGEFSVTWNSAFAQVMDSCAEGRADGVWITADMKVAYQELHEHGEAHSIEIWWQEKLVGGLYGVQRGALFAAESMFFRRRDASKVAMVHAVHDLSGAGIELFDAQIMTPHLETMGAVAMPRQDYLRQLAQIRRKSVNLSVLS